MARGYKFNELNVEAKEYAKTQYFINVDEDSHFLEVFEEYQSKWKDEYGVGFSIAGIFYNIGEDDGSSYLCFKEGFIDIDNPSKFAEELSRYYKIPHFEREITSGNIRIDFKTVLTRDGGRTYTEVYDISGEDMIDFDTLDLIADCVDNWILLKTEEFVDTLLSVHNLLYSDNAAESWLECFSFTKEGRIIE